MLSPGKQSRGCPEPSSGGTPSLHLNARKPGPEFVHLITRPHEYYQGCLHSWTAESPRCGDTAGFGLRAFCFVVCRDYVSPNKLEPVGPVWLVNADGRGLTSVGLTTMKVHLPNLISYHTFVVAECLSAPAILGRDFLIQHGLVDFENGTLHNRASVVRKGKLQLLHAGVGRRLPTSHAIQRHFNQPSRVRQPL